MAQQQSDGKTIAVFYAGASLARQLALWGREQTDCSIEPVAARSAPAIRASLRAADVAVVDATEDDAQAIDAFSQAMVRCGARRTAVYTEHMHEGLELFVRMRGAQLLFGPLGQAEWDGFFRHALPARQAERRRAAA